MAHVHTPHASMSFRCLATRAVLAPLTLAGAAAWALALGACSSSTGSGGSTGSSLTTAGSGDVDSYCTTYCDRSSVCDTRLDDEVCVNTCTNELTSLVEKLRPDVITSANGCFQAKDCASISGGNALVDCMAQTRASMAPSAGATAFCSGWSASSTRCGETLDQAKCLDTAKPYNDEALQDATSCISKACSVIEDCIGAALAVDFDGGARDGGARDGGRD